MVQMDFTAKRVWVTGAGQGIGFETAKLFGELGADVLGLDKAFPNGNYPFTTVVVDISQPAQVADVCEHLLEDVPRVDVLVNAAGILRLGDIEALGLDDWQQCFDVNVSGAFYILRHLIPYFKQQGAGTVVSIGSNAAHVPRMQMAAYCASRRHSPVLVTVWDWSWLLTVFVATWFLLDQRIPRCSAACGKRRMLNSARLPVSLSNIN